MKATSKATSAILAVILLLNLSYLHLRGYGELSIFLPRRLTSTLPSSRISFTLLRNNTFRNLYTPFYRCTVERKHQLHPDMQDTLNFTTKISTNLKILFMGDSVAVQNAQSFQEAAGATERKVFRSFWQTKRRKVRGLPCLLYIPYYFNF